MTPVIRPFELTDADATLNVFLNAVRVTAATDYTTEQVDAWTAGIDLATWGRRRASADTWVAQRENLVVGFIDIDAAGYIDMLFVDPSAGRSGVATALLQKVQGLASARRLRELTVNASKTARPIFEHHGFTVIAEQEVERNGVMLTNYRMSAPVTPDPAERRWLPAGFAHPEHVDWGDGVHLRPIRAADVDIDMPAVMGAQPMLWAMYGQAWGWPPAQMTAEEDAADLQHHADEMLRQESFNYAILPADESELYGCLYIDPVNTEDPQAIEAEVSWWLTSTSPESLRNRFPSAAVTWLQDAWPFTRIHTPFNTD